MRAPEAIRPSEHDEWCCALDHGNDVLESSDDGSAVCIVLRCGRGWSTENVVDVSTIYRHILELSFPVRIAREQSVRMQSEWLLVVDALSDVWGFGLSLSPQVSDIPRLYASGLSCS